MPGRYTIKPKLISKSIIWLECTLFGLVLLTLWLDEYLDLPHLLFGAKPTPYQIQEYFIESASVMVLGMVTMLMTWILSKHLKQQEQFVRVCSWCKRVSHNGRWVGFEEYLHQEQDLSPSHGICEECAQKAYDNLSPTKR